MPAASLSSGDRLDAVLTVSMCPESRSL
ncbi:MAG: hypothetical protein J07HB67_00090, partial [halophilic archaeon J07HB67]